MSEPSSPRLSSQSIHHRRAASVPATGYPDYDYALKQSVTEFYDPQAERVSNLIDEELKKESQARNAARKRTIKVMLLGQAESGKSTLQKQFQLYYASKSLDHERPSWIPIVHFNIIKAIRMILDELDHDFTHNRGGGGGSGDEAEDEDEGEPSTRNPQSEQARSETDTLRNKLFPLVAIEDSFASELNGGVSVSGGRTGVFVRAGWQGLLTTATRGRPADLFRPKPQAQMVATLVARNLSQLHNEISALWRHPAVKRLLTLPGRPLRLDESAPFFLDNIARISEPDYLPTTDDLLNVRLQTLGVIEHSFPINMAGTVYEWRLYDVGGARGQRSAWVPYFDDATAIIFLAPISAFDQYLDEDPRTNRIDDSLRLFTAICANELLKKAHLVLLLNKTDLLRKKIASGASVKRYITSYGNRPNTFEEASEYFRAHFAQVHRKKDPARRTLFIHFTSMLDIKATQSIIANVGEAIITKHIQQTGLT